MTAPPTPTTTDKEGVGRVLPAGGPGRPKQAQVAHEQERGAGEDGEGETTVLPKNERPPRRGAVPRFFRREIPAVVSLALHSKEQQRIGSIAGKNVL